MVVVEKACLQMEKGRENVLLATLSRAVYEAGVFPIPLGQAFCEAESL
jgi:hypothetical protein